MDLILGSAAITACERDLGVGRFFRQFACVSVCLYVCVCVTLCHYELPILATAGGLESVNV